MSKFWDDTVIMALTAFAVWVSITATAYFVESKYKDCRHSVYKGDIKAAQASCYDAGYKPEEDK